MAPNIVCELQGESCNVKKVKEEVLLGYPDEIEYTINEDKLKCHNEVEVLSTITSNKLHSRYIKVEDDEEVVSYSQKRKMDFQDDNVTKRKFTDHSISRLIGDVEISSPPVLRRHDTRSATIRDTRSTTTEYSWTIPSSFRTIFNTSTSSGCVTIENSAVCMQNGTMVITPRFSIRQPTIEFVFRPEDSECSDDDDDEDLLDDLLDACYSS